MNTAAPIAALLLIGGVACGSAGEEESSDPAPLQQSAEASGTPEPASPSEQQAPASLEEECEAELRSACWLLGKSIEAEDQTRARRLYRQSCRTHGVGCADAARLAPQNARPFLSQGCRAGDLRACGMWATLPELLEDPAANLEELREARRRGCRAGWAEGCEELRLGDTVLGDTVLAAVTLPGCPPGGGCFEPDSSRCQGEVTSACVTYGHGVLEQHRVIHQRGAAPEHIATAAMAFQTACESGQAEGCQALLELRPRCAEAGLCPDELPHLEAWLCALDPESDLCPN